MAFGSMRSRMARFVPHAPGAGLAAAAALLLLASPAHAYIGPGAGFAVMSSFLVVLVTLLAVVASVLAWPFRALWRLVSRTGPPPSSIGRLVVLGFDGQDPVLTDRFMADGLLPNFSRLAATGAYRPLQTTYPALSPVAWSSFSTGTHPARHNIFDFLDRDRRTYLPRLSSTRIGKVERFFRLGQVPDSATPAGADQPAPLHPVLDAAGRTADLEHHPAGADHVPARSLLRRRTERDVRARRAGHAGDVPAVHDAAGDRTLQGGRHPRPIELRGDRVEAVITGPENAFVTGNPPLEAPLALALDRGAGRATLTIGETSVPLEPGRLSDWVPIRFPAAPTITVAGIARCQLLEMGEHVSLYMSPINLDPEQPAMPISHPGTTPAISPSGMGRSPRSVSPRTPGR